MASNSHQRYDSSDRSRARKLTYVSSSRETARRQNRPLVEPDGLSHGPAKEHGRARGRSHGRRSEEARGIRKREGERADRVNPKRAEREQRQRAKKRAFLRRVLTVAVLAIGVAVAWRLLSDSPVFAIEEVRVEGAKELSAEEVRAIAGIGPGATLLNIDKDAIVQRLKQVPWIADADVVRSFPCTAVVRIRERERYAIVDTGDTLWAVDREGRVLGESTAEAAGELPVIRDVQSFAPTPGEITGSVEVRNALAVLEGISDELREQVRIVSAPAVDETTLVNRDNVEIMVGRAERLDEKSALVLQILKDRGDSVVFVDVRSVERPVSRGLGD